MLELEHDKIVKMNSVFHYSLFVLSETLIKTADEVDSINSFESRRPEGWLETRPVIGGVSVPGKAPCGT